MTFPRPARAEYLLLVFLLGLFLIRGFLPAWRSLNTDFRNYYVAARLYREKSSMLRVYDFTWFQRQKDHAGMGQCLVGFVPDTLLSALPIVPSAEFPPLTAKRYWLVINAAILVLSAVVLTQITQLGWRRVLIVIFLAVEPLATSFLYGQMHLLVFFLLALAVWCSERHRPATSGICVALATALKLYPALFLAFFIRKKQWRALAGMVVGLFALAGLSIYLFGWGAHRIYLHEILPQMGRGENIDPYAPQWNSLTALLHRAFIPEVGLNPHPLVNAPYGLRSGPAAVPSGDLPSCSVVARSGRRATHAGKAGVGGVRRHADGTFHRTRVVPPLHPDSGRGAGTRLAPG